MPFIAYGVAGVWKHRNSRPLDAKHILDARFASGEIAEQEYVRRLSLLTYGPPLAVPDFGQPLRQLDAGPEPTGDPS